jgi:hypothetical protein
MITKRMPMVSPLKLDLNISAINRTHAIFTKKSINHERALSPGDAN